MGVVHTFCAAYDTEKIFSLKDLPALSVHILLSKRRYHAIAIDKIANCASNVEGRSQSTLI